jgi:hypothetical protein
MPHRGNTPFVRIPLAPPDARLETHEPGHQGRARAGRGRGGTLARPVGSGRASRWKGTTRSARVYVAARGPDSGAHARERGVSGPEAVRHPPWTSVRPLWCERRATPFVRFTREPRHLHCWAAWPGTQGCAGGCGREENAATGIPVAAFPVRTWWRGSPRRRCQSHAPHDRPRPRLMRVPLGS